MKKNGSAHCKVTLKGKLLYPTEYLAAIEFQGKDVTLTIDRLQEDKLRSIDGDDEFKPVLYFVETKKKLIVCKTSLRVIGALIDPEADNWNGHRITLYPTTCLAYGETVDCIRVRPTAPPAKGNSIEPLTTAEKDAIRDDQLPEGVAK